MEDPPAPAATPKEPEKVHVLQPEYYQDIANKNPNGPRTTFYPQKKEWSTKIQRAI